MARLLMLAVCVSVVVGGCVPAERGADEAPQAAEGSGSPGTPGVIDAPSRGGAPGSYPPPSATLLDQPESAYPAHAHGAAATRIAAATTAWLAAGGIAGTPSAAAGPSTAKAATSPYSATPSSHRSLMVSGPPTTTPTPTRTPTDVAPASSLIVDSDAGRVYASFDVGGSARLLTYGTHDGMLQSAELLTQGEVLLGMDAARRLYLYHPDAGVRLLDADDRSLVSELALPTPDIAHRYYDRMRMREPKSLLPLVDRSSGDVLTFHGMSVQVHDPDTGAVPRTLDIPLPDTSGPIYHAALSAHGRVLYLAVQSSALGWGAEEAGAVVVAMDAASGELLASRAFQSPIEYWLSWDTGVLASACFYKDIGCRLSLWRDGREVRRFTEAGAYWTAHDSSRDRLLAYSSSYRQSGDDTAWLLAAEAATLRQLFITEVSAGGPVTRYDPYTGRSADGFVSAYDPGSDNLLGRSGSAGELIVIDAGALAPLPAPTRATIPASQVSAYSAHHELNDAVGTPVAVTGYRRVRVDEYESTPAISRDGGDTWTSNRPVGLPGWPGCIAVSPDYAADQILFGCVRGLGVFRSQDAGRSWIPAGDGIRGLHVTGIALSPDFSRDRTLFATNFTSVKAPEDGDRRYPGLSVVFPPEDGGQANTAWRSRDGGENWTPVGRFAALAVSPGYARDVTVMAFEYLGDRLYASADGGDNWEARGRLPELQHEHFAAGQLWILAGSESGPRVLLAVATSDSQMGGGPHWPESGWRLFRSKDDGYTWDLAWEHVERPRGFVAGRATLLGPVDGDRDGNNWVLQPHRTSDLALTSHRDGIHWYDMHLPSARDSWALAVLDDGRVVVTDGEPGGLQTVPLSEYDHRRP